MARTTLQPFSNRKGARFTWRVAVAPAALVAVESHPDAAAAQPADAGAAVVCAAKAGKFYPWKNQRHPGTSIIWAHAGLGRIVRPVPEQIALLDRALSSPALGHVNIDLSWDEVAKYITASPEAVTATAGLIERHPDRFLFGSDVVAPADVKAITEVFNRYAPLWAALTPQTSRKLRLGNYERIFDDARRKVRAWEKAQGL